MPRLLHDDGEKLQSLVAFDQKWRKRYARRQNLAIIGVDEVGRGCLAGPVVAAAVILPQLKTNSSLFLALRELDDSKKLTAKQRESLSQIIESCAITSIAQASPQEIDEVNILQASLMAMERALAGLQAVVAEGIESALILVDGNKTIKNISQTQVTVIQGDSQSASIAAASVVAKVFRDKLMGEIGNEFPEYLWHNNKGYPSKAHREAISRVGLSPWHRLTFSVKPVDNTK